ncbi:DUF7501 family protein [Halobaculum sp. D14]|uniref:DUF7501 family protein n=1 Tax=Halobaculum sp. D14 TaxID=3421642 RepID=UPI003EBFA590
MAASATWTDPNTCPFCGTELRSPGNGFVSHLDENPDCNAEFEEWRSAVSDDMTAGWSG